MPVVINGTSGVSLADSGSVNTSAIVDGAVSASKMSGAQSGNAPVFGARAWVVFSGGTPTVLASGNVSDVTRNSVGVYTITFATAMPDANYAVVGTADRPGTTGNGILSPDGTSPVKTATQVKVRTTNSADGAIDPSVVSVAIFR